MSCIFFYETPIGKIGVAENGTAITHLYLKNDAVPADAHVLRETELLAKAGKQLEEFFAGKRKYFDLELAPEGTAFQQRVWQALLDIPYGEIRSYRQVAEAVGSPKACRAVGNANGKNPIAIFIPCHRVIGTSGKLVGFGGGLDMKEQLLGLEKAHKGA